MGNVFSRLCSRIYNRKEYGRRKPENKTKFNFGSCYRAPLFIIPHNKYMPRGTPLNRIIAFFVVVFVPHCLVYTLCVYAHSTQLESRACHTITKNIASN